MLSAMLSALGSKTDLTLEQLCADLKFKPETFYEVTGDELPQLAFVMRNLLLRRSSLEPGQIRLDALAQLQIRRDAFLEILNDRGIGIHGGMAGLRPKSAGHENERRLP